MKIPQYIKDQKPTEFGSVEIRCFKKNLFYVYQVSSVYDKKLKRAKKITGKSVGKITKEDGFIPNNTGYKLLKEKGMLQIENPIIKNFGAYETLLQLSPEINKRLKKYFPDIFREIRCVSLLRLIEASSIKTLRQQFLSTCLSDTCPDIATSEKSILNLVYTLGLREGSINQFLRDSVPVDASLLFDGTSIFVNNNDSYSQCGYNTKHSKNKQCKIMYVFDDDNFKPCFYKLLQGSCTDTTAFIDTVFEFDLKNCTVVADKGFYSKKNINELKCLKLNYILPLQKNTTLINNNFFLNSSYEKFDGNFSYKKRLIWFKKIKVGKDGNYIYIYKDEERFAKQHYEYECNDKNKSCRDRLGYFYFISNLDVEAQELYLKYKKRWDIENMFDYLKNSVSTSASYARNNEYLAGWTFLNHISLLYYYGLINALNKSDYKKTYSPEDIIKLTKNIYKVKLNDNEEEYKISRIQSKTEKILKSLNVNISK